MFQRLLWVVLACVFWISPAVAAELRLTWEVIQPFRFFKYPSDEAVQEWAFKDVGKAAGANSDNIVSEMEKRLNSVAWWNSRGEGEEKTRLEAFQDLRRQEYAVLKRPYIDFDPRLGWASMLRDEEGTSPSRGTCWNSETKSYAGCVSDIGQMRADNHDDYVMPKRHMVVLRVESQTENGWKPFAGTCSYSIDAQPSAGFGFIPRPLYRGPEEWTYVSRSCGDPVYLRTEYGKTYPVQVETGRAHEAPILTTVTVKDFLIVGIGDSFASGEGNPEVPATLDTERGIAPYIGVSDSIRNEADPRLVIPTRRKLSSGMIKPGTAARWLDDQCHRSIYSAQARTAIGLAFAGARHHSVTYISYACSGAEISDGLFWPQDHRECVVNSQAGDRLHQPQLSGVIEALGSGAIRKSVFPVGLAGTDLYYREYLRRIEIMTAKRGIPTLRKDRFACASWPAGSDMSLHPRLKSAKLKRPIDLLLVSIGGNDIGFGPLVSKAVINSPILPVVLPHVTDRALLKYQQAAGAIDLDEAKNRMGSLGNRFRMLRRAITEKLEIDDPARVVLTAYPRLTRSKDGFCKTGNNGMNISTLFSTVEIRGPEKVTPEDADGIVSALNANISTIANLNHWTLVDAHVDKFVGHSFCDFEVGATGQGHWSEMMDIPHRSQTLSDAWQPLDPTERFFPYETRRRWVRTFNDAYLLSFYFKGQATAMPAEDRDDFGIYQAQRALGGPMHPSAEGHAHIADAMLHDAEQVLFDRGLPRSLDPQ